MPVAIIPTEIETAYHEGRIFDFRKKYLPTNQVKYHCPARFPNEIIEKIKDLVNREESINKTFHEFRVLQNEWHNTGVVPQNSLKDLWEKYHYNVEIFYDYIKINKEIC